MSDEPLCVYCRQRPVDRRYRPFCSERCKMADLGRWLQGDYRVAGPSSTTASNGTDDEEPDDRRNSR
jgi:endogenous inhibitor of DNA gyrase (YacG/DUF329 family)